MRSLLASSAAVLALAVTMGAADVTGIWTGQVQGRNGEPQDIAFRFKQEGATLTGKMYGDSDDTPISEGKLSAGEISFAVTADFGSRRVRFLYTGKVNGDEMQLTREPGPGSGGRRPDAKQTFSLKRLTGR